MMFRDATHQKMHDGLWDEVLDRLPSDAKVASDETPDQGRFHLLSRRQVQGLVRRRLRG
jgi:hypothetical protein